MYVSKVYQYPVDAYGDVRTLVRGITFQCPDDWEDVLDSIDEYSNLYLLKEPNNPKDKLAIAAYLDDRRIGYVAASDNGKIWLYMTDDKMPCQFLERFEASFKIAFENPRSEFETIPFKDIYKDKDGVTEKPYPAFEIPFLTNPKDKDYDWFDDRTYIMDLERFIPDFRRKLASRMIVLVGRKNSKGEYCYYLPYANNDLSEIKDDIIKGLVDKYGFVIAIPDVPAKTEQGGIIMDLHVTFLKNTDYKNFDTAHQSELVFSLIRDYDANAQKATGDQSVADGNSMKGTLSSIDEFFPLFGVTLGKTTWEQAEKMGYKVKDNNSGSGKNMYINDLLFDDYDGKGMFTMVTLSIYDCDFPDLWKSKGFSWDLSYDEWIDLFRRLGFNIEVKKQPCREEYKGIESLDAEFEATSSDGLLGFDMFFCYGENGYYTSSPKTLNTIYVNYNGSDLVSTNPTSTTVVNDFFPIGGITLGKTTWKQAEEKGYVVEIWEKGPSRTTEVDSFTFWDHEGKGVFTDMYKTRSWHDNNLPQLWESKGFFWNNSYDQWINVFKQLGFIIKVTQQPCQEAWSGNLALKAKFEALSPDKSLLFTLDFSYGRNGHHTSSSNTLYSINVQYKGSVAVETSQIISEANEKTSEKVNRDEKDSSKNEIQDAVFHHCIFEVLGVNLTNTPNSTWKYESWDVLGGDYETYVFSAPTKKTEKFKKCEALVNRNYSTNYKFKELNANTVLSLLYHYRRVFDNTYKFERCKEEYFKILDNSIGSILITETEPWLSIGRSDGYSVGDSKTAKYDVLLFTSQYNKEYIDELIFQKKLITIF